MTTQGEPGRAPVPVEVPAVTGYHRAGRAPMIVAPAATGYLAIWLGSVGLAASSMALCGVAAALVYVAMPETKGRTLEETAGEPANATLRRR